MNESLILFSWTLVFVSTILSLIPLFILGDDQRRGIPSGEFQFLHLSNSTAFVGETLDSVSFLSLTDDALHLSKSFEFARVMGPFLGIALPVMMDVIVDIYVSITRPKRESNVVRLTLLERSIFVVGVFVNGLYLLFPLDWHPMLMFTVQSIFANINTLLTAAPIIIFLERTIDVMTPTLMTCFIILLCSGIVCLNFTFLLVIDPTSITYKALFQFSEASLSVCFGGIILASMWTLYCFLSTNRWVRKYVGLHEESSTDKLSEHLDPFEKFSQNQVPAAHCIALCTMCVINIYWFNTPTVLPIKNVSLLNLLLLLSTALILTVEMRIRQNEIIHGLFLLDSKKSFVRFVSHEVRTPLSTALMGLELLGIDVNDDTEDETVRGSNAVASLPKEDFEALQLVHESLSVAVSIFDNLAEYDALGHENQKMDLNITSLNAATLIHRIVRPLQLQARRNHVEMTADCLDAMVDVDQRRMAQAIRALVSTAIALTPKTGYVTISLRFENAENYQDLHSFVSLHGPGMVARTNRISFAVNQRIRRASSNSYVPVTMNPAFAVLEIKYDGPGFDRADTKRMNKKLFFFDPRELHGGGGSGVGTGSGLGLALAKMITEAHGGHVWVSSEGVGKGASLSMGLPLSNVHKTTNPSSLVVSRNNSFNYQHHSPTITGQDGETGELRSTTEGSISNKNRGVAVPDPGEESNGLDSVGAERGSQVSPPVIYEQDSGEIHLPPPPPPPELEPSTSLLHVLVVEDSAVARLMLVKMLKSLKFTTEEAEDGIEAIRMVQASINKNTENHQDDVENGQMISRTFDLILCDSVMPNMAGPQAIQRIRAMGYTNPILGVTGNTLPEQVEDFIAHGVNDVLSKPVKLNVLKEALTRHLKVLNK